MQYKVEVLIAFSRKLLNLLTPLLARLKSQSLLDIFSTFLNTVIKPLALLWADSQVLARNERYDILQKHILLK